MFTAEGGGLSLYADIYAAFAFIECNSQHTQQCGTVANTASSFSYHLLFSPLSCTSVITIQKATFELYSEFIRMIPVFGWREAPMTLNSPPYVILHIV